MAQLVLTELMLLNVQNDTDDAVLFGSDHRVMLEYEHCGDDLELTLWLETYLDSCTCLLHCKVVASEAVTAHAGSRQYCLLYGLGDIGKF